MKTLSPFFQHGKTSCDAQLKLVSRSGVAQSLSLYPQQRVLCFEVSQALMVQVWHEKEKKKKLLWCPCYCCIHYRLLCEISRQFLEAVIVCLQKCAVMESFSCYRLVRHKTGDQQRGSLSGLRWYRKKRMNRIICLMFCFIFLLVHILRVHHLSKLINAHLWWFAPHFHIHVLF